MSDDHKIPEDAFNSDIMFCIAEFVREVEHREILLDWWFHGYTLEGLADKYNRSLTGIKTIVYKTGDKILLKAMTLSKKKGSWMF